MGLVMQELDPCILYLASKQPSLQDYTDPSNHPVHVCQNI